MSKGHTLAALVVAVPLLTPQPALAQASPDPAGAITFSKDVAPILQRSCQVCHRKGAIAPMSLVTYEETRPWARAIRQKVADRTMPPWTIDRNVGIQQFKGDRSLKDDEVDTIVRWVDAGAPMGNPADMPPPVEFPDQSKFGLISLLGEPDLVVPIPEPFVVEANAPNMWIDLYADHEMPEDRWVRAFETKPSAEGFPVVHHGSTWRVTDDEENGSQFSEYALGKTGDVFPEGSAMLLRKGTRFRFNMHYAPNGTTTTDRTSIAIWFYPKGYEPARRQMRAGVGGVSDLDLPPGESDIRHDGYRLLTENIRLTAFQPHLHSRGKRQCLEAIYADGRVQSLSCVNWDFGWHITYNYAEEVQPLLPKGTMLHVITWHDNSKLNKWNPDPQNWAGYGQRTSDDMAFAWLLWYTLSDDEFNQAVQERVLATRKGPGHVVP
ncbi:MAG: cytochrome c [Acidimicrobiia bacterium]|nr:cytochrome c [Acidimicrobiia bacterium]